jgi:cell wall assembly regulator SMI1
MKDLWEALERWAGAQVPELVQGFRPGATDKRLDALESDFVGFRLAEDFGASTAWTTGRRRARRD